MQSKSKRFDETDTATPAPGSYDTGPKATTTLRSRSALGTYGNAHSRPQNVRPATTKPAGPRAKSCDDSVPDEALANFLGELGISDVLGSFSGVTLDDLKGLNETDLLELLKDELSIKVIPRNKIIRALSEGGEESNIPKLAEQMKHTQSTPALPTEQDTPQLVVEPPRLSHSLASYSKSTGALGLPNRGSLAPKRQTSLLGYDDDDDDDDDNDNDDLGPMRMPDLQSFTRTASSKSFASETSVGDGDDEDSSVRLFPRPFFGTKVGEYPTRKSYEAAKRAVRWARDQVTLFGEDNALTKPECGGSFPSQSDVDFAIQAIMRSRVVADFKIKLRSRLEELRRDRSLVVYDPALLSRNGTIVGASLSQAQIKRHLVMPTFGPHPGEYPEMSDYSIAKAGVTWARKVLSELKEGDLFPQLELGQPGAEGFKTTEQIEKAKQSIMWSLLEARTTQETLDSLEVPPLFEDWDSRDVFEKVVSEMGRCVFDSEFNHFHES